MLPLLLRLRSLGWRKALGIGAGGALLALLLLCWRQRQEIQKLSLAYENPKIVTVEKVVKVQGPTVIKERIVRVEGREEIVREETWGETTETFDGATVSEPVFAPAGRGVRFIGGLSNLNLRASDRAGWTAWGGASARHLNILGGLDGDLKGYRLQVLWRF